MMRQITLETSKDTLQELHELVDGDGRKKSVTVSKGMLSRLLVDHHRLVAHLGPVVKEPDDPA